jgi:hypothetical protein
MACISPSMAAKPTDEGLIELEQVLQELMKLLGSEPLSNTTPMHLEECYLYCMTQVDALTKVGSLLQDQRERVQSVLAHHDYFQPGGGGRLALLSFDEMVTGPRGVDNRFETCFCCKPEDVVELAEKLHFPSIRIVFKLSHGHLLKGDRSRKRKGF